MNNKKAKSLRKYAKHIFLIEKEKNNEKLKDIEIDTELWMENTTRKVLTKEPDYVLTQAFDGNGLALKNIDGTAKLISAPKLDQNNETIMRDVEWAPGTITVHPHTTRGLYRNLKKLYKKSVNNLTNESKFIDNSIKEKQINIL